MGINNNVRTRINLKFSSKQIFIKNYEIKDDIVQLVTKSDNQITFRTIKANQGYPKEIEEFIYTHPKVKDYYATLGFEAEETMNAFGTCFVRMKKKTNK